MISRYQTKEMHKLWNENSKFEAWLKVEILNCEALHELGLVTNTELELLKNASFKLDEIAEIELETRHDVVAFTRSVSRSLGNEAKWIHYGLTSTDVVDTSYGYLYKQANDMIFTQLELLVSKLKVMAVKYKETVQMGRTHGIHAELTTFGFKMAIFYEEFLRHISRFKEARLDVETGKISGAVGTYSNVDPFVEQYICQNLNINAAKISTQVLQRDRHAHYLSVLTLIASSVEKLAVEIRHLQRTEVGEVREGFMAGQKGSSAMPHKRNPITCENLCGLSRVMRGYMLTSYENIALWHERDISHSGAERIIMPDATSLLQYMLIKMTSVLDNLVVCEDKMLSNILVTNNVFFAQRVMSQLIIAKMTREEAYDLVQPIAMDALNQGLDFKVMVHDHVIKYMSQEQFEHCFVVDYHLPEIRKVFERLGL